MSYTPTEWKTGDIITAEKLNNMESGIVGGQNVMVLGINNDTRQLDKTWNEIAICMVNGGLVVLVYKEAVGDVVKNASAAVLPLVRRTSDGCYVYLDFPVDIDKPWAKADSPDGYPVVIDG